MNNHKLNKYKTNTHSPQTKNYSTLFSTVSKTWPSGPECWPRKYGWFSSGRTKQVFNPDSNHISTSELNHHSLQGRRSRPLGQALPALNRRWYSSSQSAAFTIIEVVLVLAIAGLIFLMVFIALPALQRNQRDTQRKNDVGLLVSAVQRYQSNNQGRLPLSNSAELHSLKVNYLSAADGEFTDPSDGRDYVINNRSDPNVLPGAEIRARSADGQRQYIYYISGAKCAGDTTTAASPNRVAIAIRLESGGVYCVDV